MTGVAVHGGLLERDAELARIGAALEAARAGRGGVVVIEGPPGIGKSSLLREAWSAAAGFTILRARGGELEQAFPWGVVRQLFEAAVVLSTEREALLSGAAVHAGEPLGLAGGGSAREEAEFAALHGLYWLVVNLAARGPLLLAVDDLQWADLASARFVAYLARRVEELPVVLLAARRPEGSPELDPALEPGAVLVRPAELTELGCAAVVAAAWEREPDAAFVSACRAATGGNPFLLAELVAELRRAGIAPVSDGAGRIGEVGPASVGRAVLRRVAAAAPGAPPLAGAVAVLGTNVELRHAAALAGLDAREGGIAADALAQAAVLRHGRPLEFVHPVVRAAVRDALPPSERAALHERAARLLAADGAGPGRVAVHLLESEPGGDAWAGEVLHDAARRALANGAPDAAARFLDRALGEVDDEPARVRILRDLGRAELLMGERSGVERLRAALEGTTDPGERAWTGRELGLALTPAGSYVEAVAALERAAAEALRAGDAELALRLEAELGTAGRLSPQTYGPALARLAAVDDEGVERTPAGRMLLCAKALTAVGHGTAREARALARRALAAGLPAGPTETNCLWDAVYALTEAEAHEDARSVLDAILGEARASGSILSFARASCFRAVLFLRAGLLSDAETEARASVATVGPRAWIIRGMAAGVLADALAQAGRGEEALQALEQVEAATGEIPHMYMLAFLLAGRARARLAAGDAAGAAADLETLGAWGAAAPPHPWRALLAEIELRRGAADRAREHAEAEVARARAWGAGGALGAALRVRALCDADPEPRLAEAVALLEQAPLRLERARALVDLGAAIRRSGRPAEARDVLRRGLELADRCGAEPLAARAREELLAAGARPRRTALSGIDSLTPSERRVAAMAAEGMTNREIAQALFVTPRTVEVHLTHAYGKLGIGSRAELPAALSG